MSTWNYRVMEHVESDIETTWYAVHEVFYDEDNNVTFWTEKPVDLVGETYEELQSEYSMWGEAFTLPTLPYSPPNFSVITDGLSAAGISLEDLEDCD